MILATIENYQILCHTMSKSLQIIIPTTMQSMVLELYHEYLQYPGMQRMYNTMRHTVF